MSERISDERLKQIKERVEKATPGPWEWDEPSNWLGLDARVFIGEPYGMVAQVPIKSWKPKRIGRDNADFIAHARTDIPDLLSALSSTEELVRKMAELLNDFIEKVGDGNCRYDHHGFCQEHLSYPCIVKDTRVMLADPSVQSILQRGR